MNFYFCESCNKKFTENMVNCPHCNATLKEKTSEQNIMSSNIQSEQKPVTNESNGLAIAGLVLSVIGFSVIGLILSCLGYSLSKKRNDNGKSLALAGIIISSISIAISVIVVFVWIGVTAAGIVLASTGKI